MTTRLYDIIEKIKISNKPTLEFEEMTEPGEAIIDGPFLTEGRGDHLPYRFKSLPIHLSPGSREGAEADCDRRLLCEILGHPKLIEVSVSHEESIVEGVLKSLYDKKLYGPYAVLYTPYKVLPFVPFPRDKFVQALHGREGFEHFISVEHNLLVGRVLIIQYTSDLFRVIDMDQDQLGAPGVHSLTPQIRPDYNGDIGALLVSFRQGA